MKLSSKNNRRKVFSVKRNQRKGAAAVEFAMTVPILILFLFATFELGRGNMMLNTTEAAAYEAARVGIIPGSTAAEAEESARQILVTAGVNNASVAITPNDLSVDSESVSVTVTVGYEENSILPPGFLGGASFVRTCVLNRESTN